MPSLREVFFRKSKKNSLLLVMNFFLLVICSALFFIPALPANAEEESFLYGSIVNHENIVRTEIFNPGGLNFDRIQWIRAEADSGRILYFRCSLSFLGNLENDSRCVHDNTASGESEYQQHLEREGRSGYFAQKIFEGFLAVMLAIFQLSIWILGIAGTLLEFVIAQFVLGMSQFVGSGGWISVAIVGSWTALRDIVNLAFIGGLVWASISLILGIATKPQELVVRILVAALLVNFSFFFAALIIDASNFLSGEIYEAGVGRAVDQRADLIRNSSATNPDEESINPLETITGLGAAFMEGTRLSSVLSPEALRAQDPTLPVLFATVMGIVLFLVTAYVFFFATFLLVTRFVVLVILLITSPIGILRWTGLPQVSGWGQRWWNALISQALFAPVFFLFIGISIRVISSLADSPLMQSATLSQLATGDVSNSIGLLAVFIIAIGFMWASLVIARQISESAADFKGLYKASRGVAGGVVGGTAGVLGISALGRGARALSAIQDRLPGPVSREVSARVLTLGTMGDRKFSSSLKKAQETKVLGSSESFAERTADEKRRKKELQNLGKETVIKSFDDEDFQKLRMDVATMSNEDLKKAYSDAVEKGDEKRRKQILLADPDRRGLLLDNAPTKPALEQGAAKDSSQQSLDGDARIDRATNDSKEQEEVAEQTSSAQPDNVSAPSDEKEVGKLQKDLAEIRENTGKTADNTARGATEEKKQRVIEQLRNKEKRAVREDYTNLDTQGRSTLKEVVIEHVEKNPNDVQIKEVIEEIKSIETSPVGMVARQKMSPTEQAEMDARMSRRRRRKMREERRGKYKK